MSGFNISDVFNVDCVGGKFVAIWFLSLKQLKLSNRRISRWTQLRSNAAATGFLRKQTACHFRKISRKLDSRWSGWFDFHGEGWMDTRRGTRLWPASVIWGMCTASLQKERNAHLRHKNTQVFDWKKKLGFKPTSRKGLAHGSRQRTSVCNASTCFNHHFSWPHANTKPSPARSRGLRRLSTQVASGRKVVGVGSQLLETEEMVILLTHSHWW